MSISNKTILPLFLTVMLWGCGSGGSFESTTAPVKPPVAPVEPPLAFNLIEITPSSSGDLSSTFTWDRSVNATEYSLCIKDESKPDDCDEIATSKTTSVVVNGLGIVKNLASQYFVLAKNASGTKASNDKSWDPQDLTALIAHVKSPNTDEDLFGEKIALSSDGKTLVVGAAYESSNAKGVNAGKEDNNDAIEAGAVYVFRYSDSTSKWTEQAYIKASNTDAGDVFGDTIALSSDGNTLAVGAFKEDSNAKGVNTGEQGNNDSTDSGAVYVFRDSGTGWTQQAYIKASNSEPDDLFGKSIALSPDGKTLAVGVRMINAKSRVCSIAPNSNARMLSIIN